MPAKILVMLVIMNSSTSEEQIQVAPSLDASFSALAPKARVIVIGGGAGFRSELNPLTLMGSLTVPICQTYPLDQAAAAYESFAGVKLGKIVLDT